MLATPLLKSSILHSPAQATILLVTFFSLMHLFTMGNAELTNDEAQYALYGYYLDWSYFDHPPLSGWLNAFTLQFSESDFALRIWPFLLAILTSFLLYSFSRELFSQQTPWIGFITVLLYQASVISQLFALAMLPDTPLIPLAIAASWLLYRVLKHEQTTPWLYVGVLFGLAGLAKYTAVTLVVAAIIALIIFKQVKMLKSIWPWLAMVIAAAIITPVLYWNLQHDWISITYQLNHGSPDAQWQFKKLLVSQAAQLITYTPVVFIFGLLAIFSALKNSKTNEKYILAFALPVLALFAWSSGYEQSLPHWTAVGWILLTPLIANWLIQHWQSKVTRVFTYIGLSYSLLMALTVHLLLATSILPFENNKHPLEDIYGWKKVAERAVEIQKEMQQEMKAENKQAVIFVGNWSQFARLAWYAKPNSVQVTDLRYGQSDIWYGSATKGTQGVLVVPPKYAGTEASGLGKFTRCDKQENVSQILNNKIAATYYVYKCYGYKG